jgi:hypothetical protein
MHSACERGQLDIVRLLGAHGVDLEAKDKQGRTPWQAAANDDIKAMLDRVAASLQDDGAKSELKTETAAVAALDGEARAIAEAEERRIEAEAAAQAKAEAEQRMAELDEQRRVRAAQREAAAAPAGPVSPGASPRSPASEQGATPASPVTPGDAMGGDEDDDDEPTPGDLARLRPQIPHHDAMEQLRGAAAVAAKAKADAWRLAREEAKKAEGAKAAVKAEEAKRLLKAQSEVTKQREEAEKKRLAEEAAAKAAAIAAMVAKMNDADLSVPEAAEGSFSYEALKGLSDKEAMRGAGVHSHKREWYLGEGEFGTVMGMGKEAFYALPQWKRDKIKKEKGLF